MNGRSEGRVSRRQVLAAALAAVASPPLHAQGGSALDRIRQRGSLIVGVYHDMPPFHVNGEGIDVDIAAQLAQALGVRLTLLPFHGDENMNDDLRNMVWKGHYLGWGPADVLLHVPVDRPLMDANPRVQIFAPYYRERVAIAWSREALGRLERMDLLRGKPVAVAGQTLPGWLMIGAEGGVLRESLRTQFSDGAAAARALASGEVLAAAGLASELESVLAADARFGIGPLPMPLGNRSGWAIGCAVKKESTDLAQALQAAMGELTASARINSLFASHRVHWVA
ncbi:substrate-binding periplasmic protein [Piscinibacter terrae]|uniref:ABC transporter substrate-binding protein n=1 Tax=Piscinibacter terrae TaxID=2496871 RepID=A0A3N7HUX6_9BURK|nr:transporter substrate-binding domain-containing protein [Albitalea terrae]RQP25633.1 ABC transporter substrate-binding protein [Albitalea terrae]